MRKYEELISGLLGLLVLLLVILGFLSIIKRLDVIFNYQTRHIMNTEQKRLIEIATHSAELKQETGKLEDYRKFVYERCVCVRWDMSQDELPMTKKDICNYPLKMGQYTERFGYSHIQYWTPESGRYKK